MVGLGRVELPTSPLSGVRSSHLSYRPVGIAASRLRIACLQLAAFAPRFARRLFLLCRDPAATSLTCTPSDHTGFAVATGGAGRDRTGDLLNANQALSQLSYSPKRNQSRPVGCRDQRDQLVAASEKPSIPSGDCRSGLTIFAVARIVVWSGTAVSYSAPRTLHGNAFGNSTHVLS